MPDSYPEWPSGPQVHAYLTDYAKDHGLMSRMLLNTTVVDMARRDSGLPGWTLKIRNPDSSIAQEDFDFVAVCTGQFNERRTLKHSWPRRFQGRRWGDTSFGTTYRFHAGQRQEGRRARGLEIGNGHRRQLGQRRCERSDDGVPRTGLENSLLHRRTSQFQTNSLHPRSGRKFPRLGHKRSVTRGPCNRQAPGVGKLAWA
jgi:Flavin-binding monooxygenase-like